jgi:hypothetical protein
MMQWTIDIPEGFPSLAAQIEALRYDRHVSRARSLESVASIHRRPHVEIRFVAGRGQIQNLYLRRFWLVTLPELIQRFVLESSNLDYAPNRRAFDLFTQVLEAAIRTSGLPEQEARQLERFDRAAQLPETTPDYPEIDGSYSEEDATGIEDLPPINFSFLLKEQFKAEQDRLNDVPKVPPTSSWWQDSAGITYQVLGTLDNDTVSLQAHSKKDLQVFPLTRFSSHFKPCKKPSPSVWDRLLEDDD